MVNSNQQYRKQLFELEQDFRRLKRTKIVILYRLLLLYYLVAIGGLGAYLTVPYGDAAVGAFAAFYSVVVLISLLFTWYKLSIGSCSYNSDFAHWVMGRYYQKYDPEWTDYRMDRSEKPSSNEFQRHMRCLTGASAMRPQL